MIRVAAIADLHCREERGAPYDELYAPLNDEADVLVIAGDLTNLGRPEEARALAGALHVVRIPIIAVLGNHDHHSDRVPEVKAILQDAGLWLLEGGPKRIDVRGQSLGFAGSKGFGGGFGNTLLTPFGEPVLKAFVNETVNETSSVERSLAGLATAYRIVVWHYAPIRETVQGENPELFPFLGSSLLSEPVDKLGADLVLHGHAHHGASVGQTPAGIPVRNVALPVLRSYYVILELGD